MKYFLSVLFSVLTLITAFSQSAEGRYASRRTVDGVIFFIMPEKLKDVSGIKRFDYDMTLLSWTDSVTVNFTFESTSPDFPENLRIICDKEPIDCTSYSSLFVDIKKNHFEVRITSKYSLKDIQTFIQSITPPIFCFLQSGELKTATYKNKTWVKDRKKLSDIIQLYYLAK